MNNKPLEFIQNENDIYAIIVRSTYTQDNINFFTTPATRIKPDSPVSDNQNN